MIHDDDYLYITGYYYSIIIIIIHQSSSSVIGSILLCTPRDDGRTKVAGLVSRNAGQRPSRVRDGQELESKVSKPEGDNPNAAVPAFGPRRLRNKTKAERSGPRKRRRKKKKKNAQKVLDDSWRHIFLDMPKGVIWEALM